MDELFLFAVEVFASDEHNFLAPLLELTLITSMHTDCTKPVAETRSKQCAHTAKWRN